MALSRLCITVQKTILRSVRIYEDRDQGGANLTSMASNWNYWGWSKYVIGE